MLKSIDVPRHWWASIVLMVVLIACVEAGARFVMRPIGDNLWAYGAAGFSQSFEWYRHLSHHGATPEVVVIGDSTGVRNFDPVAFTEATVVKSIYSLARAGNFPLALRSNTLPLLADGKSPEIVVLLQWPGSFRDDPRVKQIEAGALSPILEARRTGQPLVTDFLYMTRLFPARKYLANYWIHGEELLYPPENLGFSPFRRGVGTDSTIIASPSTITQNVEFSGERRSVIRDLVELAHEQGFLVVAVVGPFRAGKQYAVANQHLKWLRQLESSACGSLALVDHREAQYLDTDKFRDNHHLYSDGAAMFTANLAEIVFELRKQSESTQSDCSIKLNSS